MARERHRRRRFRAPSSAAGSNERLIECACLTGPRRPAACWGMRFENHTILELALVVRDSKVNAAGYDRDARDNLRRVCRLRIGELSAEAFLAKYPHATDRALAQQAWSEVQGYARPAG